MRDLSWLPNIFQHPDQCAVCGSEVDLVRVPCTTVDLCGTCYVAKYPPVSPEERAALADFAYEELSNA